MSVNSTIGLLAVRKIASLLSAAGTPAPVERTDTTEYTEDRLPAYNVFRKKDGFTYKGDQRAASASFEVVVRAMVAAASETDEAIDPLVVWVWQKLMADEQLGNLVDDAKITSIEYQYVPKGSYDLLAADIMVDITVDVGRSDPTQNLTFLG